MTSATVTVGQLNSTRRAAVWVDLIAVAATLYANIAHAPKTVPGVVLAGSAPAFLGLAIALWHRSHGVLTGWAGRAFTAGLSVIAAMCFIVSYSHIRDLALDSGQSVLAAGLLPLVIDGTAVLSSVVVLACGREMEKLRAVEQAQAEAARRARRDADDDARRLAEIERAEAERIAAEADAEERRIAAETERERQLLQDRQKAAKAAQAARKTGTAARSRETTEADIGLFLAAHADDRDGKGPTADTVADSLGISKRHVMRSASWKNRNTAAPADAQPATELLLDVPSTTNGTTNPTTELETV